MAQMINSHLAFKSIIGPVVRLKNNPGIVQKYIQPSIGIHEFLSEAPDRFQMAKIQMQIFYFCLREFMYDLPDGLPGLDFVPAGKNGIRPFLQKCNLQWSFPG